MVLKKIYRKKNKRFEWVLVSISKPRRILYYFGTKKPTHEQLMKQERRVQYFKRFGSSPKVIRVRAHKRKRTHGVRQHTRKIKYPLYLAIMRQARKRGLKIPKGGKGKGPLAIDEVDIPEPFLIDGITIPIEGVQQGWGKKEAKKLKGNHLIIMDDDAPKKDKKLAFAHELGHVHMFEKKEKPHTERKADKYAAKIFNLSIEDYDKLSKHLVFDQDIDKPGIQLPKKRRR